MRKIVLACVLLYNLVWNSYAEKTTPVPSPVPTFSQTPPPARTNIPTAGSLLVWVSIFIVPARGVLYGIGFALYTLALIPLLISLSETVRDRLNLLEPVSS